MASPVVCVPMKVDAFVLNPSVCKPWPAPAVAPITQPNYTFLRLDGGYLQPDVLPHVDLHAAADKTTNSRITNLASGDIISKRVGVYLHWILPRFYRSGVASTNVDSEGKTKDENSEYDKRTAAGYPGKPQGSAVDVDPTAITFRSPPNRWLIVRSLDFDTVFPIEARKQIELMQVFLLESDTISSIDKLDNSVDLEVDVTPFIHAPDKSATLQEQAEVFIGTRLDGPDVLKWAEGNKDHVDLSVLNSSNPLFPDFTYHNSNVFSIVDRLEYGPKPVQKLTSGTASYQVMGWHSDETNDPFFITAADKNTSHQTIVDGCKLTFSKLAKDSKEVTDWLNSKTSTRIMCHGSIYNVEFSADAPMNNVGGDKIANLMKDVLPISIGTTPLDASLAFVAAHIDTKNDEEKIQYKDLQALQPLLLKQEESTDGQLEAADMLSAHSFTPSKDSGGAWHIMGQDSTGKPTQPTDIQLQALRELNMYQDALDITSRDLAQARWDLWSMWWKYYSNPSSDDKTQLEKSVPIQSKKLQTLQTEAKALSDEVQQLLIDPASQLKDACQLSVRERFCTLREPTLLVAGVPSPWPSDYLNDLMIRLDSQIVTPSNKQIPGNAPATWQSVGGLASNLASATSKVMPTSSMKAAIKSLLLEFYALSADAVPPAPPSNATSNTKVALPTIQDPTPSTVTVIPLYHDQKDGVLGSRDDWSHTQPWFPLFMEWEALYYHIPWEQWSFEHVVDSETNIDRIRYGLTDLRDTSVFNAGNAPDVRRVSGRTLILPQPSFSFQTVVKQLLASTSMDVLEQALKLVVDMKGETDPKKQKDILDAAIKDLPNTLSDLQFLSAPLDGFTSHLITQMKGNHVKPGFRVPGQALTALPDAITPNGVFKDTDINLMGGETALTPYANQVSFGDSKFSPFKPVTHGQFCFTKLNIIDKFGQCVSALDPTIDNNVLLHPVLSEFYRPQIDSKGNPMVVQGDDPPGRCRFAQIPPNINQDARINAVFLTRDLPTAKQPLPPWRPALEWESPIWGWIIVNYAEAGLQFFLPDGTFYAEVRAGGVGGTTTTHWKPFQPAAPKGTSQLDALLQQFDKNSDNLRGFITTLTSSLDAVPHAPASYGDYLSAIIGRPLALVNTGWSLELANDPLTNQSSQIPLDPKKPLMKYTDFMLKLGHKDRVYDGVVALWDGAGNKIVSSGNTTQSRGPDLGHELDLDVLWTYFPDPAGRGTADYNFDSDAKGPHYLKLQPYKPSSSLSPEQIRDIHHSQFEIVGAVIDPFTAMHGYTGILPITQLKLPPWSVELALKKMTAFFSIGPLLITTPNIQDRYQTSLKLDQSVPPAPVSGTSKAPGFGIPIPAIQSADFQWLQPYHVDDSKGDDGKGTGTKRTEWNGMAIEPLDNKAKLQAGPYTAVEGYLQLRSPLNGDPVSGPG